MNMQIDFQKNVSANADAKKVRDFKDANYIYLRDRLRIDKAINDLIALSPAEKGLKFIIRASFNGVVVRENSITHLELEVEEVENDIIFLNLTAVTKLS